MPEAIATTHEAGAHSALQHHFENMEQQREAGTLGMWVFLVTEIMFFGALFLAYTLYRYKYPEAFAAASNHLDLRLGAITVHFEAEGETVKTLGVPDDWQLLTPAF